MVHPRSDKFVGERVVLCSLRDVKGEEKYGVNMERFYAIILAIEPAEQSGFNPFENLAS